MSRRHCLGVILTLGLGLMTAGTAHATIKVQCPGDNNGDAVIDPANRNKYPDTVCRHLVATDGFTRMSDGRSMYIFGFKEMTGVLENQVAQQSELKAQFAAPTIMLDEGDEFYLTLSNVAFAKRPDLFDAHSVHWHGFPNASSVFDGEPEASFGVNPGASLTYFYKVVEPGSYLYHCHVEATEHMQMGMLGSKYVRPAQNRLPNGTVLNTHVHRNPDNPNGSTPRAKDDPLDGDKYAYNDGDGSTLYDVEYPIQIHGFDPNFHQASIDVQPPPFAMMTDTYPMLNGRGYPDTVNPNPITIPDVQSSHPVSARITAQQGQKILLRLSSLSVTSYYTLASTGLPMKVVGHGARILKGNGEKTGKALYYTATSVTMGGGEARDVIVDTTGVQPGTYFLYTSNLNNLSNDTQDLGGMMTEIIITAAGA
ncbi:MAG TPA: multicopper oxidase domain-containing protein [Azospirillaceae bacterium]|nr:multicopper oxidase domain-containing protein [Azospirillaceae bacterium]